MSIIRTVGSQNAIGKDVPVVVDRWDLGVEERFTVESGSREGLYVESLGVIARVVPGEGRQQSEPCWLDARLSMGHGTLVVWCAGVDF
jgi:hypothetical protein